jgi:holo-[acyl-carrier protein] synthase
MEQAESLRKLVAEFFEIDPGQIESAFPLSGKQMQGSLARAKLDAAIRRRLGVKAPAVYSARTYGQLEIAVLGTTSSAHQSDPARALGPENILVPSLASDLANSQVLPISCGIDIELVESLPRPKDYWEHEFYRTCFTPAEIAYCLTRDNPRVHFAARWCAKEALKKCDSAYLKEEMSNVEVTLDAAGVPSISHRVNGTATRLPYALSVSHTDTVAVAVVIQQAPQIDQHQIDQRPDTEVNKTSPEPPAIESKRTSSGIIPTLLSLVAIALALWALVRTIMKF